jgi:hypothetical protein
MVGAARQTRLISYNPEQADGRPLESWQEFRLFRTGDRTVLRNWQKNDRIVWYDTQRGMLAEATLIAIVDIRAFSLEIPEVAALYRALIRPPLYPFEPEENIDDTAPLHLFYDDFVVYPTPIPIAAAEEALNRDLRQPNGSIVNDADYAAFLSQHNL